MRLRTGVSVGCLFLWSFLFIACRGNQSENEKDQQKSERPNIIYIMSDDHASKAISAYDSSLTTTPNIDRIANEGMLFTNANVTNSLCAPSRAVLLTGKYSNVNGLRNNQDTFNGDQNSWAKMLHNNGYFTSIVGKWHLKTKPQGFDYWDILVGQGEYYNPDFIENGDTMQVQGYVTNIIMDKALQQLKNRDKSKPFAIMIHNKAPHRSWLPDSAHIEMFDNRRFPLPETFFDDYTTRSAAAKEQDMQVKDMFLSHDLKLMPQYFDADTSSGGAPGNFDPVQAWMHKYNRMDAHQKKIWDAHYDSVGRAFKEMNLSGKALAYWKYQRYMKDYLRTVASVDDNVGRLLDYLDKAGLAENTIVVYTSDQGFFLGEHGWFDKRFMYEPSLKTPLLVRYPKEIKAGSRSDALVSNLDFAPTFVDEAGLKVPDAMQGKSLQPIFKGNDGHFRDAFYYHYYDFYPYGWHAVKRHYGIKTDRWKLIHFYDDIDAWELYDLKNDSLEVNNLYGIPQYQPVVDSMKNRLRQLQIQYKDTTFDASLTKK